MVSQQLLMKLIGFEGDVVPTLFKPMQFRVIKKLCELEKLTENEKRYLRGNMGKKLNALEELERKGTASGRIAVLLGSIGSYYITGLEALKHNGYGWYFDTKVIEVVNTRIEGTMRISGSTFKFIRAKSIGKSEYSIDNKTGLKYATNEQIHKDAKVTRNEYVKNVWMQMLSRYGKLFARNYGKLKQLLPNEKAIDYGKFGV